MSLTTSTRLGPYEVLALLGAGGMSEVYRARDTRLDRDVAIKVLAASAFADARRLDRLLREARAISRLNHPHVCALYDVGHQDGVTFLVMELLEGKTLADALAKGPLPVDRALAFGLQMAQALDAAHTRGVIHRDLKPGNVMITRDGLKLLDFGLAKLHEPDESPESLIATRGVAPTEEGAFLGTQPYMSPEQLEGREADARSDIFALGVVLYEMATGSSPVPGRQSSGAHRGDFDGDPTTRLDSLHGATAARPGDRPMPGKGSRGPLAECPRPRVGAALDDGG